MILLDVAIKGYLIDLINFIILAIIEYRWYNEFGQRRMWRFSFRGGPGSPQSRVPNFFGRLYFRVRQGSNYNLLSELGLFPNAERGKYVVEDLIRGRFARNFAESVQGLIHFDSHEFR